MVEVGNTGAGQFCWLDLAASDAGSAKEFYARLFGWTSHEQLANGGSFTRLRLSNHDVGSVYQLTNTLLENGMPSHWTPYVRVGNVNDAVRMPSDSAVRSWLTPLRCQALRGSRSFLIPSEQSSACGNRWKPT